MPKTLGASQDYYPELRSWHSLNAYLRSLLSVHWEPVRAEEAMWALVEEEKRSRNRPTMLLRIYGCVSRLRYKREREDLLRSAK